jgi:hypothetical protein
MNEGLKLPRASLSPMASTVEALSQMRASLETEVQSRLEGFLGGFVRQYLPQTWLFRTDQDVASLAVDAAGRVSVTPEANPSPDVTVEGPRAVLLGVLASKGRERPASGALRVTPHTAKGRAALGYLGPRFGL